LRWRRIQRIWLAWVEIIFAHISGIDDTRFSMTFKNLRKDWLNYKLTLRFSDIFWFCTNYRSRILNILKIINTGKHAHISNIHKTIRFLNYNNQTLFNRRIKEISLFGKGKLLVKYMSYTQKLLCKTKSYCNIINDC